MTLLVNTGPFQDESPLGYYRRLSAINQLSNWKELTKITMVSRSRTGLLGQCEHVAQELGLDPSSGRWTNEQEARVRKMERLHRGLHDAVCPPCLKENPYLRLHWEHVYTTACCAHRTQLIDHCDWCGSLLISHRAQVEFCECGRDLRDIQPPIATASQLWLSSLLSGITPRKNLVGPKLARVDNAALVKLVRLLCHFFDPRAAAPQRNASPPRSVNEAIEFLKPLEFLLGEWPLNFETHVINRLGAADSGSTTLNSALGYWYKELKRICAESALRPFLDRVVVAATGNFGGLVGLDAAGGAGNHVSRLVYVKDAARRLGMGRDQLYEALEKGLVSGHTRKFGERRLAYQIDEFEIQRLTVARAAWVDQQKACELLDIPESVLSSLVAADAITKDVRWRSDIFKGGPVSLVSVQVVESVLRTGVGISLVPADAIALRDLTSRRVGDKRALQEIFKAIMSGKVQRVGTLPAHGVGSLRYRLEDVREFFGTPLVEAGMTIERLTHVSGWKYESVSHWISLGLLESETIVLRGQSCRVIMPEQLLKFSSSYVPLADFARTLGMRASAAAKHMKGLTVVGAKIEKSGVARGGLIRTRDLAVLALERLQAGAPK